MLMEEKISTPEAVTNNHVSTHPGLSTMNMLYSDSDMESYSEISDDNDDRYDNESVFGSHARSILSSLDESIRRIDDFLSLERGFAPGDFVCSTSDQPEQIGRVVSLEMKVDLEDSCGQTIKDIDGKTIQRICSFSVGDYVIHGSWLGRVDKVFNVITVLFDDGAKCQFTAEDLENLMPFDEKAHEDAPFPHYSGQRVKMRRSTLFNSARSLCGSWNGSQDEGTICQVEVGLVSVNWTTPIIISSSPSPPPIQDPKDLRLLTFHDHEAWQIGEWCKLLPDYFQKNGMKGSVYDRPYIITKMKTKLDISWQDGQRSGGVDPRNLLPVNNVGDHDFWPEQIVLEKAMYEDSQRLGVVKNVNAKERMVEVRWIPGLENSDIVSAYELVEHPDYNYRLGEIVLRRMVNSGENLHVAQPDAQISGDSSSRHLSCIGKVVGSKDGEVEVRWASGVQSRVRPAEVYALDKLVPPPGAPADNSQVTEENDREEHSWNEKEGDLQGITVDDPSKKFWNVQLGLLPRAASGFLSNVVEVLFGQHRFHRIKDSCSVSDGDGQRLKAGLAASSSQTNGEAEYQLVHAEDLTLHDKISRGLKTDTFKQFDVADEYSDHHFIERVISVTSQVRRGWSKKIQQEWSVLEDNLPDTIYVRVYEERMDLMRAAVIGSPGTPYHDGLFFFDLHFPPDYPLEPPVVHYHSGGLRLNPNLYESGKVCLSLLKTWTGTESEVWDPQGSTVLQLLLSLQALVLNDNPYFNEAGYERQLGSPDGERNAVTYNENAFILSCRSMLYVLKNPPKGFETFVVEHFRRRSAAILAACEAYVGGAPVAAAAAEESGSTGFKIMVGKLLPKLVAEFAGIGTD